MARTSRKSVDDFVIDFNKEVQGAGGGIRVKPGSYRVRIINAKPVTSKDKGTPGLELKLKFMDGRYKGKTMTETVYATPKSYGRFRTMLEALGKRVPTKVNLLRIANAVKGGELFVVIDDEAPREGYRTRSRVVFDGFVSLEDGEEMDEEDDDEDDVDEEEDDIDEDDDEDIDDEEEDEDDVDDDDEEDEPEPPKRKRAKAKASTKSKRRRTRDDEDELDLDDF